MSKKLKLDRQLAHLLSAVGKLIGRAIPCPDQDDKGEFPLAYVHCEDINAVRAAAIGIDPELSAAQGMQS